jgi:hypothetical protein
VLKAPVARDLKLESPLATACATEGEKEKREKRLRKMHVMHKRDEASTYPSAAFFTMPTNA